jgi:hypothetical protein
MAITAGVNYEGTCIFYDVYGVNLGIDALVFPQTSHQVSVTGIFVPGLKPFRAGTR